jgi:hypothetical protein
MYLMIVDLRMFLLVLIGSFSGIYIFHYISWERDELILFTLKSEKCI